MIVLILIWHLGFMNVHLEITGFHSMQECNQMKTTHIMSLLNRHANIERAVCVIESRV